MSGCQLGVLASYACQQPHQDSCEPADLCLTCFGSEVIPHHIHSYCIRHGDLSSFVHLTKAAIIPKKLAAKTQVLHVKQLFMCRPLTIWPPFALLGAWSQYRCHLRHRQEPPRLTTPYFTLTSDVLRLLAAWRQLAQSYGVGFLHEFDRLCGRMVHTEFTKARAVMNVCFPAVLAVT